MRILVTGSEGLLGSSVVPALRELGHDVTTLDMKARNTDDGCTHIAGDMRDIYTVRNAVQGMDVVVHLAAMAFDAAPPAEVQSINVPGTWNVAAACQEAGIKRIVYASSINATGAVGNPGTTKYLPIDDNYPEHPRPGYQLSKLLSDEVLRSYTMAHDMVTISLRFGFISSPPSPESGRRFNMFAMPDEVRVRFGTHEFWGYIDVRDAADAVVKSCFAEDITHERFLIFADEIFLDMPTAELVTKFHEDLPWPNASLDEWVADDPHRGLFDCSKAKAMLGWQPVHSYKDYPKPERPW